MFVNNFELLFSGGFYIFEDNKADDTSRQLSRGDSCLLVSSLARERKLGAGNGRPCQAEVDLQNIEVACANKAIVVEVGAAIVTWVAYALAESWLDDVEVGGANEVIVVS